MSLAAPHTDTHLAIHEDVKANPKHLEEVPVVGPVLHEVPGKPWGGGEVAGKRWRTALGWEFSKRQGCR